MMKKVLCLIDNLGFGGAERQMAGLAVLLKSYGYEVDLLSYGAEDDYAQFAKKGGCDPIFLQVKQSPVLKLLAIYRFIKRKGGYDTIITYKLGPNAIGCLLKVLGIKSKIIVSERSFSQTGGRREKYLFQLYRFADYIVPNSYSQAEFIKSHYSRLANKVVTITNFTDTELFTPIDTSDKADKPITILTAARITKAKNIINYLRAIGNIKNKGYKNVQFLWYGNPHDENDLYCKEVFNCVRQLGLEDYIVFYPATKSIVEKYRECDFFCLPSIYEGFPNSICEAMCCGKPILCGNVCDNPHIVKDKENAFLFDPLDINDITLKIIDAISLNSNSRREMGLKSREIAEKILSRDVFVKKYSDIIEAC